MALVPVTVFGSSFTHAETVFLAALADHSYTDGQLIIGNSATGGISFNTLVQGANITITNGNGTITIASSGGASGITVGTTTITSGTSTRVLYDNAGVVGEYTISGTGTVVAMATSPSFTTPTLGVASGTSLALGGATIGTDALGVTGTSTFNNKVTVAAVSAASTPAMLFTGTVFTGGTGTTTFPHFFFQTSGATAATTWSTAGTVIGVNADSGFAGNLIDCKVNGVNASKFLVSAGGNLTVTGNVSGGGLLSGSAISVSAAQYASAGVRSATAWTTTGVNFKIAVSTFTDTSSSGTVATQYINAWKAPTVAASSATTFTDSYNSYFEAPTNGTNVTQTNAWGLGADSLKVNGIITASGHVTFEGITSTGATGTGALVFATSPTFVTPALGTPASGVGTNITGITAAHVVAGTFGTGAYTMDTSFTVPQIFNADNAVAASGNAATVTRANRNNVVTNNSAAGLTITLSTSGAVAGDMLLVQSLPSSAVAQTITWVNTEVSDVTPSANLNASTTSPRTDGFKWNPLTSKWRCIASA